MLRRVGVAWYRDRKVQDCSVSRIRKMRGGPDQMLVSGAATADAAVLMVKDFLGDDPRLWSHE